jgi:predicted transposase YdaD
LFTATHSRTELISNIIIPRAIHNKEVGRGGEEGERQERGRKEGRKEGRREGRKEGRKERKKYCTVACNGRGMWMHTATREGEAGGYLDVGV